MSFERTIASQAAVTSTHRTGDTKDASHIVLPMNGKPVEILVEEGQEVKEGEAIAFIKQMKMELEVRCRVGGTIDWVTEVEDGGEIGEGVLLAVIADTKGRIAESKL